MPPRVLSGGLEPMTVRAAATRERSPADAVLSAGVGASPFPHLALAFRAQQVA